MVLPPDDLPNDIATLKAMLLAMRAEAGAQALMIEKLTAQLAKLRRMRFGKSSEKLDAAILQLELALGEIEEDVAAAQAEQARLAADKPTVPATPDKTGTTPKAKPVRKPLPAHLPREEITHWPASVAGGNLECGCPGCGGKLRQLGQDETEVSISKQSGPPIGIEKGPLFLVMDLQWQRLPRRSWSGLRSRGERGSS